MGKIKNSPNTVFDQASRRWVRKDRLGAIPVDPQLLEKATNVTGTNVTKEHFEGDGFLTVGSYVNNRRLDEPLRPIDLEGESEIESLVIDDSFEYSTNEKFLSDVSIPGEVTLRGDVDIEDVTMQAGSTVDIRESFVSSMHSMGATHAEIDESTIMGVNIASEGDDGFTLESDYSKLSDVSFECHNGSYASFDKDTNVSDSSFFIGADSSLYVEGGTMENTNISLGRNSALTSKNVDYNTSSTVQLPDFSTVSISDVDLGKNATITHMSFTPEYGKDGVNGILTVTTDDNTHDFIVGRKLDDEQDIYS